MFLYGIPFVVVTDHKPLVNLSNNPKNRDLPGWNTIAWNCKDIASRWSTKKERPIQLTTTADIHFCKRENKKTTLQKTFSSLMPSLTMTWPDVLTEKMVQDATNQDDRLAGLKDCIIRKGYIPESATDRTLRGQTIGIARDSHCASRELAAGCDLFHSWRASNINQNETILTGSSLVFQNG